MANMSDLVTTDIGIIAFWNALDHWIGPGANEIDPTECAGVFDSVNYYDNGIEGYKALGSGRYFHARVKSDGWMVAWIDRTNTFFYPTKLSSDFGEHAKKGYYDILQDWFARSNISTTQTTLSYLIALLYNALSNKADFTYADADVGHYCYEYQDASVFTLSSVCVSSLESGAKTGYVKYTVGTTLYHASVAASVIGYSSNDWGRAKFADVLLAEKETDTSGARYGTADILAEGWMPNPGVDYPAYVYSAHPFTSAAVVAILFIWS